MPYEKIGKNEPICIADEVPFEIPESWEWVRLGRHRALIPVPPEAEQKHIVKKLKEVLLYVDISAPGKLSLLNITRCSHIIYIIFQNLKTA